LRNVRRTALSACLAAAAALAAVGAAAPLRAEDDGHDHGSEAEVSLSDLTKEERVVALDAWAHVYCRCPDENWSRTMSNCPDGCAREQKQQILGRVREGWDVKRIVEEQVKLYTSKAAADPGSAWNGTYLVAFGVLAGAAAAGFVLSRWRRAAGERRAAADFQRSFRPVESSEAAAVERELQEID
jgi:cytochrome c-type biogenesis protein CcmH/NrfF